MRPLLVVALLALSGCAALADGDAPGCHGRRRPANPYGSVLAPSQPPPANPDAPVAGPCRGTSS